MSTPSSFLKAYRDAYQAALTAGDPLVVLETHFIKIMESIPDQQRLRVAPALTWADTLGNMQALDEWRRQVGVSFLCETPAGLTHTVGGGELSFQERP